MKQKAITSVVLILILLLCMTACTPASSEISGTPTPPVIEVTPPVSVPDYEIPEEPTEPGPTPDQGEIDEAASEALNRMQAVFSSYARAMSETGTTIADTSDPVFFWRVLCYVCADYAELHPLAEKTDKQYMLPGYAVREFAEACFYDLKSIPEVPKQMFDIIFDAEADQYYFGMLEGNDQYAEPVSYKALSDGNYEAEIAWISASDGREIAKYIFTLGLNANVERVEPLFEFSVISARATSESLGGLVVEMME